MNYTELKEAVESNLIATIQVDFSDGKVPFDEQLKDEITFCRGIILGARMCEVITKDEFNELTGYIQAEFGQALCEWDKQVVRCLASVCSTDHQDCLNCESMIKSKS